jgi:hypothetical protein
MASLPIRVASAFQGEHEEIPESVGPSTMLLAAFAMENLLKGLVVIREPGSVQPRATDPERLLDWEGSGHDLLALARRAGEKLSAEEEDLMRLLTEFVLWAGRYPVSMRAKCSGP